MTVRKRAVLFGMLEVNKLSEKYEKNMQYKEFNFFGKNTCISPCLIIY